MHQDFDFSPMLAYHFVANPGKRKNVFESELSSAIDEGKGVQFQEHERGYYVVNPIGWYMSIKLNGIRGIWYKGEMRSRIAMQEQNSIRTIMIPESWKQVLPMDEILDGELYMGKDRFYELMPIIHGKTNNELWSQIKYHVFDIYVKELPFAARFARLREVHQGIVERWNALYKEVECPIIFHKQCVVENWPRAFGMFKRWILEDKEEGAILKNPNGYYHNGRSYDMLKWKVRHKRQAMIIGFQLYPSTNRLQSLQCRWLDNTKTKFRVSGGLNNKIREKYEEIFKIGETIMLSYYEVTMNDHPVSAVILFSS
jgi:DNA ligase-1